jgi:phosphoglycolate phosphatase
MKTQTMIHTIIFDLDGTLADSAILTMLALQVAAPKYGLPMPPEASVKRAIGYANPEFYHILFPGEPCEAVLALGEFVEQEELRILPSVCEKLLFEGCKETLLHLHARGLHLYIASTGDQNHVYSILEGTGIIALFDRIACGRPDKIAMLHELSAQRNKNGYMMIGDMRKDYEAARANGILSVGACYGYCNKEKTNFDLYVDAPSEILNLCANAIII